jgi:hypothetical protein
MERIKIKRYWDIEPDPRDDADTDPYGETSPENILAWLRSN